MEEKTKMRLKLPKYVQGMIDRHGRARYYFRRPGYGRIALPGIPYSLEFMAAYEEAQGGERHPRELGKERSLPGTINALTVAYFNSAAFQSLASSTQNTYRGLIDRFREEYGENHVRALKMPNVQEMMDEMVATPSAASNRLRIIRMLMKFAIKHGWRDDDPTVHVDKPKMRKGGFHSWSDDELDAFRRRHPTGTRARLAFDLCLYTAQRRSDVIRLGRQHMSNGYLSFVQQKTKHSVTILVVDELRLSIEAASNHQLTFLVTEAGAPFTAAGFGNWFRQCCRDAGLKNCSAHGLRKATGRILAESDATPHQIMAILGHSSLKEADRYTAAANRKALATEGMKKITSRTSSVKPQN